MSTLWPLVALIVWGLMQSIAWTDQAGQRASLSLDVEATRGAVLWLSLLVIAFVVSANLFISRARLKLLRTFAVFFGLALSLFALLQQVTWNGKFYWLRVVNTQQITMPFGPFVHHGHYAGYIELLLPIPIAFLVLHRMRLEKKLLYGFAGAMMGLSIMVSLARGGMLSLVAQLIFLAVMGNWILRKRREEWEEPTSSFRALLIRVGAVLATVIAIFVGVLWIGVDPVLNRVAQGQVSGSTPTAESFFNNRGWIWRDAWAMFRAHPITGTGLGTFETTFPLYSESDGSLLVSAAHNDFLQILSEGGIVAGALAVWFLMSLGRLLVRALHSQDSMSQALALGSGAAVVGMLVHSCFDFNLQLPSHALLFLLLVTVLAQLSEQVAAHKTTATAEALPATHFFELSEHYSKRGTL